MFMLAGRGGKGRGRRGGARPALRMCRLLFKPPSSEADSVLSLLVSLSLSGSLAVGLKPESDDSQSCSDIEELDVKGGGCGHRRTWDWD
jgi:hypothetical protein